MNKELKVAIVIVISMVMVLSVAFIGLGNSQSSHIVPVSASASISSSSGTVYELPNVTVSGFSYSHQVPANTELNFEVYVPLLKESVLNSYASQVSIPGNPLFDHFMNYSQIEKEFMNTAQFNADKIALIKDGFTILTANDPIITARGTEAQIQSDLGLHAEYYSNGTSSYYYAFGTPTLLNSQIY